MNKFYISTGIIIVLLLLMISCNPFGVSGTKVYVNGTIYLNLDSVPVVGADGVAIYVTGTSETILTSTNCAGYFEFEIQLYPEGSSGGGGHLGSDGTTSGTVTFGVKAINGTNEYIYGGTGATFTLTAGDTLNLYDIDLTMFKDQSGSSGTIPK